MSIFTNYRREVSGQESPVQESPVQEFGPRQFVGRQIDGGVYVDVDGTPIWHYATGDPSGSATVLLHGSFGSASDWGAQVPDFVNAGLRVFMPERTGHGHSPDAPGPFTYTTAAHQMIRYLETAVGGPAHLVGWSDGATVAAMIAAMRPDLVHRMVLVGQIFHHPQGLVDDFSRRLDNRDPDTLRMLRTAYARCAPEGADHFDVVFDKTMPLLYGPPGVTLADLASIPAPTLVIQGDQGSVSVSRSIDVADALPNGRVAVLPGTHILPVESPDLFNPVVISYLSIEPPSARRV